MEFPKVGECNPLGILCTHQAIQMAEDLIKQNLKDTDQTKMVEDYLEKVGAIQ